MENTPITQEIFSAFMKCLNQYDFNTTFDIEQEENAETEVDEVQMTANYFTDMEQLKLM